MVFLAFQQLFQKYHFLSKNPIWPPKKSNMAAKLGEKWQSYVKNAELSTTFGIFILHSM